MKRTLKAAPAVLAALAVFVAEASAQMGGPSPVYLEPVQVRSVRQSLELLGVTEARRKSTLGAEVAGRIEKILAEEGDYVKAGDPVAQMRRLPVELQLKKAEGQQAAAQAELEKMEQGYRSEEIAQAKARAEASRAALQRWQQDYERTRQLLADGASTQAEMDAAESAYRQAKEQVAADEASLALVTAGYRAEDIRIARAQLAAQTAAAEELKDTLAKMTVTMPFDGFVVRKLTDEGEWLTPGVPVAEVVDLDVVRVRLDVPESYLKDLEKGAPAPVVFEALGDREFTGTVSQIVPSSAEGTHTVSVRVDVANTKENDRPLIAAGLLARVWLPVGKEHEALLVPKSAVIRQQGQDLVYTVSDAPPTGGEAGASALPPDPTVKFAVAVPVRIVQGYGRLMEVEAEGLKAGTLLITRGTYLMAPGTPAQVRPKEAGAEAAPTPAAPGIAP